MRLSLAIVATLLAVAGCSGPERTRPTALPIVGPDGSPMLHVSCGAREGQCYELAGRYCPLGYAIATTGSTRGNFLVRCRRAPTPVAFDVVVTDRLAPSPYVLKETVEPWPPEALAPSPYRDGPTSSPPAPAYPPLAPGRTGPAEPPPGTPGGSGAGGSSQDLGF